MHKFIDLIQMMMQVATMGRERLLVSYLVSEPICQFFIIEGKILFSFNDENRELTCKIFLISEPYFLSVFRLVSTILKEANHVF